VSDGFVALMTDASHGAETFTNYILKMTFVGKNNSFPPYLWTESQSSDPRTTNGPEAFYRDFNSRFYTSHLNYFSIINIS